jgi:phage terminase large subunit GpA-like protein
MSNHNFLSLALREGLRPEQDITVSEWADANRILSSVSSAEPGRWRTDRFPYLREIMDSLSSNSNYEQIVFQKGSQIGATETGNNWIGYVIHHAPGPMLAVMPTVDMAKDNSKTRIDPLIEESPALRDRVKEARSRDSGNTTLLKEFNGGFLAMVGSNAPGPMRSKPIRYLFLDEVDSYPGDVGNEGDPVMLAKARTRTFSRRKIFLVSTPTMKDTSRIERAYLETDQRRFFIPCPKCNEYQYLQWTQLRWEKKDPKTAHYQCIKCNNKIYNHEKELLLKRGVWKPTAKTTNPRVVGFHLSSLYSPVGFYSWEDAVEEWLNAQKNIQALKTFVNTVLGETWDEKSEAPEWEYLYNRKSEYKAGIIPMDGTLLVGGADVQSDRIEIEIVAYGKNKISYSIEYIVIMGDPSQPEIWNKLDNILGTPYKHESGQELFIEGFAIDSGYKSAQVYDWTRTKPKTKVFAVKGSDSQKALYSGPKILDIRMDNGKKIYRGARLWTLGVSELKTEFYDFLRQSEKTAYGYCNFPEGYSEEYYRQLTSEILITHRSKNGRLRTEWKKTRERNEALDCRIYARGAACILGVDRWTLLDWESYRNNIGLNSEIINSIPPSPKTTAPPSENRGRRILSKGVVL